MQRASIMLLLLNISHLGFSFPSTAQDSRTPKLVEAAKKDGALVWYLSASIEDARAIFLAFNKKYPFIKAEFFRASSARLFNRIVNEARAGKVLFDVVAVRGLETQQLVKAGCCSRTFRRRTPPTRPASRIPKAIGSIISTRTT